MRGIDSNILLRYLLRDDENQYQKALNLFKNVADEDEQVFVNLVVLIEVWWVLDHVYEYSKEELIATFKLLLNSKEVVFQESGAVLQALNSYKSANADFEDCLINQMNTSTQNLITFTFDKKASKLKGMKLLK